MKAFCKILSNKKTAQSLAEVAIFGAIMIFMVGTILRTGLQGTMAMNQELRAMRIAMLWGFRAAGQTSARRNTSSIMLVEDRLSVDPEGKFLTTHRMPFMSQANVIHGKNLFMPVEYGDDDDLPVFDLYINGVHFEFQTARYRQYYLTPRAFVGYGIPYCTDPPTTSPTSTNVYGHSTCWDPDCGGTVVTANIGGVNVNGCPRLHAVVGNYPASSDWNAGASGRFNLNFDGGEDVPAAADPQKCPGKSSFRECFMWQWRTIYALASNIDPDPKVQKNVMADVDNDYKEEYIKKIGTDANGNVITSVKVIDYNAGDIDSSWDDRDDDRLGKWELMLQKDTRMYSIDRQGMAYEIREGRLFGAADGQYVRTTNRQDHVDIIQRVFQLSNNTGRFCQKLGPTTYQARAPVEVCATDPNDCNSPANVQRICMDTDDLKLYIRNRVWDTRQRRWVTRVAP